MTNLNIDTADSLPFTRTQLEPARGYDAWHIYHAFIGGLTLGIMSAWLYYFYHNVLPNWP